MGATSFGTGEQCGTAGSPGVYAKVANYKHWIKTTTGNGWCSILGPVLISDKTSCHEISQSLEGARSGVKMFVSH